MAVPSSPPSPSPRSPAHRLSRVIGDARGASRGPCVVFVAGLHGNEPAGTVAAERVAAALAIRSSELRGRVVFLAGNRQALAANLRFVRRDLDSGWSQPNLERLRRLPERELGDEDQEQVELADALHQIGKAHGAPLIVVDLHTTSAASPPFVCFGDTLRNRQLAMALPLPAILGLDELIDGTLVGYCTERGHVGISVEAGQHRDPVAVERHVAAIWLLLVAAGCLPARAVPELASQRARLARASAGCPRVVEVLHRHVVNPTDQFQMLPGFASFARVAEGDVIAHDAKGPVLAPRKGLLLMPRYQPQGADGFFLAREVRPVWLGVSALLRRAGATRLVPYLPGVRRDPREPRWLLVDPRVARTHVAEVMHLFGYRRRGSSEERLVFSRRGPHR
jgi:succinylglutamate desuccinylase